MNHYDTLYRHLEQLGLKEWSQHLRKTLPDEFSNSRHGSIDEWQKHLCALPQITPVKIELKERVEIGLPEQLAGVSRDNFSALLKAFHPWRKGPYRIFGVDIETEWRSDWKWDRLLPHIQPLAGRKVLDVGCSNGYHGWRMRGEGAEFVLGIDPVMIYVMQFQVLQRYLDDPAHHLLPLRMESLPGEMACFDTVFSLGVLYHRRSPLDHLLELKGCLRSGGQLVLETLVVEGDVQTVLTPHGRYAKMRNVWFIPSVETMIVWLERCGFDDIVCADTNRTSIEEQRRTDWMCEESLADFLDPADHTRTIEGHPAPVRAIFTAIKT